MKRKLGGESWAAGERKLRRQQTGKVLGRLCCDFLFSVWSIAINEAF